MDGNTLDGGFSFLQISISFFVLFFLLFFSINLLYFVLCIIMDGWDLYE